VIAGSDRAIQVHRGSVFVGSLHERKGGSRGTDCVVMIRGYADLRDVTDVKERLLLRTQSDK
jgi:hypothetical protein